jgi:hypothetical protein
LTAVKRVSRLRVFLAANAAKGNTMIGCTRVKVVDDLDGKTTIVESPRDRGAVYLDLVRLVHETNHRAKRTEFRASLHLTEELITVHFYTTAESEAGVKWNAELYAIGKPLHQIESVIWGKKGGVA